MRTGAIIQARMSSSRLPGKVMKSLPYGSEIPVVAQIIRRLGKSRLLDAVILATSDGASDDPVAACAASEGAGVFRGSLDDVLSRFYNAAASHGLDTVVRITGDCPCMDGGVVDTVIEAHLNSGADYTSNTLKRTYPHGLDVEVMSIAALRSAFDNAHEPFEREHVTPYLYRSGLFRTHNVEAASSLAAPEIRITLDTAEDYALICAVYDFLYPSDSMFSARAVVELFRAKPWLLSINRGQVQKRIFDTLHAELEEAVRVLDLQDLKRARDAVRNLLGQKE